MKITGDGGFFKKDRVGNTDKSGKADKVSVRGDSGKSSDVGGAASGDKIALSGLAKEIAKINEEVKAAPDVRVERVQELKQQIQDGTYHVDADKIAGKIVEDIINQGK